MSPSQTTTPPINLNILLVDDDPNYATKLRTLLLKSEYTEKATIDIKGVSSLEDARKIIDDPDRLSRFRIVLMDQELGDGKGLDYLLERQNKLQATDTPTGSKRTGTATGLPATKFLLISIDAGIRISDKFHEANLGFIHKNDDPKNIAYNLACEMGLSYEARKRWIDGETKNAIHAELKTIIAGDRFITAIEDQILAAATNEEPVLILGETGSGKEVVAKAMHMAGMRSHVDMVTLNCAAFSPQLIRGELAGWVPGAHNKADKRRHGHIMTASNGDLFLDEVGELSGDAQTVLLRAIEYRQIQPLGSDETVDVNTRFILATNQKIESSASTFRRDLYARFAMNEIHVPPLREHRADIPALFDHFISKEFRIRAPINYKDLPSEVDKYLTETHVWPYNVREVRALVFRLGSRILAGLLDPHEINLELVKPLLMQPETVPPTQTPQVRLQCNHPVNPPVTDG